MGIEDTASSTQGAAETAPPAVLDHVLNLVTRSPLQSRSTASTGRSRPAAASAPYDVRIIDHMAASRAELIDHIQAHAEVTEPIPREYAAVCAWYERNTPLLDSEARRVGDAMRYRRALEAAVLVLGDTTALRRERCPSCRCFSLKWVEPLHAAVCMNTRYDSTSDGRPRRVTLQEIAEKAVQNQPVRAAT